MTREEEIINSAKEHENIGFIDLVKSPASRGVNSAYGIGFIEGAVLADNTMIDKVCEFIVKFFYEHPHSQMICSDEFENVDDLLERLKLEMKGGEE